MKKLVVILAALALVACTLPRDGPGGPLDDGQAKLAKMSVWQAIPSIQPSIQEVAPLAPDLAVGIEAPRMAPHHLLVVFLDRELLRPVPPPLQDSGRRALASYTCEWPRSHERYGAEPASGERHAIGKRPRAAPQLRL